jgi:hypothetical protein
MRGSAEQHSRDARRRSSHWFPAVAGFTFGLGAFGLVQCAPASVNTAASPVTQTTPSDQRVAELITWAQGMYQWAVHIQDDHLCPGCDSQHTEVEISLGDHIRPPPPPQ